MPSASIALVLTPLYESDRRSEAFGRSATELASDGEAAFVSERSASKLPLAGMWAVRQCPPERPAAEGQRSSSWQRIAPAVASGASASAGFW